MELDRLRFPQRSLVVWGSGAASDRRSSGPIDPPVKLAPRRCPGYVRVTRAPLRFQIHNQQPDSAPDRRDLLRTNGAPEAIGSVSKTAPILRLPGPQGGDRSSCEPTNS